ASVRRLHGGRNAGFSGGNLIEHNTNRRHDFKAAPLEFVDPLLAVGATGELFSAQDFVSPVGMGHDLKLAAGQVEVDPVSGAYRGQTAAIHGFRYDMRDRNPVMLEC